MLSFSLRAVLRKESWIFCAGLFSICRSPCKFWTFKATAPRNPWRDRSQRPGGIKPASVRLFHWLTASRTPWAALRTIRRQARLFNLLDEKVLQKSRDFLLATWRLG